MKAKAKSKVANKKEPKRTKENTALQGNENQNSVAGSLNPKQRMFAEEYIKDLNGGQAYRRAGYSVKDDNTASAASRRMLRNVTVKLYIEELQNKRSEELKIDAKYVLQHLIKMAENKSKGEYVENKDRIKCLELIGKHIGMFTDKIEHSGSMNNNVAITSMTPEEREARIQQLLEKAKIIDAH